MCIKQSLLQNMVNSTTTSIDSNEPIIEEINENKENEVIAPYYKRMTTLLSGGW